MVSIQPTEFLNSRAEQHALPTGAALGFATVASGDLQALGVAVDILAAGVESGRDRPAPSATQDIASDSRREPHYFGAGLAAGACIGLAARLIDYVEGGQS